MQLPIEPLTGDVFARYGQVIAQPTTVPDATGAGWQWWAEIATLDTGERPYTVGLLTLEPAELSFDWAERHMQSLEAIIPLGGDCLVYVGPPAYPDEPKRLPALQDFQVFHVPSGQSVLLDVGVWHGAPLALDDPCKAVVLLRQDTGRRDTSLVRFPDTPVRITRR